MAEVEDVGANVRGDQAVALGQAHGTGLSLPWLTVGGRARSVASSGRISPLDRGTNPHHHWI